MSMKRRIVVLSVGILLGGWLFASAQENAAPGRLRVRENLVTLRLLRLTQALDLSEEQAAKIYPVITRMEKEKLDIQRKMSADIRDLRLMVKAEAPKDADIEARYQSIKSARGKIIEKDDELDAFLEENLTTIQKAKYLLFQIEFYRYLSDSMDRLRMMRNKPPVKK